MAKGALLILIALALVGCGGKLPPGEYDVYPADGQVITPSDYSYSQAGDTWTIHLREVAATATRTSNATVQPTVIPSPTPEATILPTIGATGIPKNTPTSEAGVCTGHSTVASLRVRSSPSAVNLSNVIGSAVLNQTLTFDAVTVDRQWYRIEWWDTGGQVGYVSATFIQIDNAANCQNLPSIPLTRLGLHLIFSARDAPVLAALPRMGSIKGTDGTEQIIRAAETRQPAIISVWRSVFLPIGKWDCPPNWGRGDARNAADSWWSWQWITWQQRGLIGVVDYFEVRNECAFVGAWEVTFDLRLIELANHAGVCLAMFSDAYGNPEIAQFVQRQPVLDAMLAQPCVSGRYHAIAHHIYEGVAGGPWKFGRYRLFLAALPGRDRRLQWLITEYSMADGRGALDCVAMWIDAAEAEAKFGSEVIGFHLYSVGDGAEWSDISPCLERVP